LPLRVVWSLLPRTLWTLFWLAAWDGTIRSGEEEDANESLTLAVSSRPDCAGGASDKQDRFTVAYVCVCSAAVQTLHHETYIHVQKEV